MADLSKFPTLRIRKAAAADSGKYDVQQGDTYYNEVKDGLRLALDILGSARGRASLIAVGKKVVWDKHPDEVIFNQEVHSITEWTNDFFLKRLNSKTEIITIELEYRSKGSSFENEEWMPVKPGQERTKPVEIWKPENAGVLHLSMFPIRALAKAKQSKTKVEGVLTSERLLVHLGLIITFQLFKCFTALLLKRPGDDCQLTRFQHELLGGTLKCYENPSIPSDSDEQYQAALFRLLRGRGDMYQIDHGSISGIADGSKRTRLDDHLCLALVGDGISQKDFEANHRPLPIAVGDKLRVRETWVLAELPKQADVAHKVEKPPANPRGKEDPRDDKPPRARRHRPGNDRDDNLDDAEQPPPQPSRRRSQSRAARPPTTTTFPPRPATPLAAVHSVSAANKPPATARPTVNAPHYYPAAPPLYPPRSRYPEQRYELTEPPNYYPLGHPKAAPNVRRRRSIPNPGDAPPSQKSSVDPDLVDRTRTRQDYH